MNGPLVVYGAGGHGKVVAEVARSAGFLVVGFIDDRSDALSPVPGVPVYSWQRFLAERGSFRDAAFALGIGEARARQRCAGLIAVEGFELPLLVHAAAAVAPGVRLGAGTVVMPMAVVNPDASVGDGVILNTACVVEHDCKVRSYSHLSPTAALGGAVTVGERTHLGIGAVAIPGVSIGDDVTVGAGAVVIGDVPSGQTVVGVPAHAIPPKRA